MVDARDNGVAAAAHPANGTVLGCVQVVVRSTRCCARRNYKQVDERGYAGVVMMVLLLRLLLALLLLAQRELHRTWPVAGGGARASRGLLGGC